MLLQDIPHLAYSCAKIQAASPVLQEGHVKRLGVVISSGWGA